MYTFGFGVTPSGSLLGVEILIENGVEIWSKFGVENGVEIWSKFEVENGVEIWVQNWGQNLIELWDQNNAVEIWIGLQGLKFNV